MTVLHIRKKLLLAESEINRAYLLEECRTMKEGVQELAGRVKKVSVMVSAAGAIVTGLTAFRRDKRTAAQGSQSWLHSAVKGAQMATSLWLALRPRK